MIEPYELAKQQIINMKTEVKTLSVALLVGIAHIISGVCIFTVNTASQVTPLHTLYDIAQYVGIGYAGLSIILIIAGVLAVAGSLYRFALPHKLFLACFVPQQILLMLQIVSISTVLLTGQYPDGYIPNGGNWFILADQIWVWVLSIAHTTWLGALIFAKHKDENESN